MKLFDLLFGKAIDRRIAAYQIDLIVQLYIAPIILAEPFTLRDWKLFQGDMRSADETDGS